MTTLEADYLVVGAGAMGMAFADTLVAETDARVIIVDRGHQPGGHWTRAYPFVRLHQPSAYYGVNSRNLGSDTIDQVGWNSGMYELATAGEVCAYFDRVMHQGLLPTGRVSYFPMSDYLGQGRFQTMAGAAHSARVRRIVDATYLHTVVPSMRPPAYDVGEGVDCVPPNDLPALAAGRDRYVIVGAGKTGIDTCLWLLRQGVGPDRLTWVMPRDSWLLDREAIQPGPLFAERFAANFAGRLAAISAATSVDDLFERLEANGNLLRLDTAVRPTMYRCATVSRAELDQLRRVEDIVRLGRVERISSGAIELTQGRVPVRGSALYIDCSADGLERRAPTPVFDGDRITLQSLRGCQQVFSAALIAHVEAAYQQDTIRNDLCMPLAHPYTDLDWLEMTMAEHRNQMRWLDEPELMDWLDSVRLDLMRGLFAPLVQRSARSREKAFGLVKMGLEHANQKLTALLTDQAMSAAPPAAPLRRNVLSNS
jgi:NAD(P)-binding Rossmann-like domain